MKSSHCIIGLLLLGSVLGAWAKTPASARLELAWLDAQAQVHAVFLDSEGNALPRPELLEKPVRLGSLWKLVAYAQWVESQQPEAPYRCTGGSREEVYCCAKGVAIDRAQALVRSCGLYFSADRVPWKRPAGSAMENLPSGIKDAVRHGTLGADTPVKLKEWLLWLDAWPAALRSQVQDDLLGYWLDGPGREVLPVVAGRLRLKTYTLEQSDGTRCAGASGWSTQGRSLWFASAGSSKNVVPHWASAVLAQLDSDMAMPANTLSEAGAPNEINANSRCIRVRYFAQYPIDKITRRPATNAPLQSGAMNGAYTLRFHNGQTLSITSAHDMRWQASAQGVKITAEMALDEYVARVIDREAHAQPVQAAWAFAIAARSYVLAQGQPHEGCLEIDDSSRIQRVAPRPASVGARRAAWATSGLLVKGGYAVPGRYHANTAQDGVMAWTQAVQAAQAGQHFTDILAQAYPRAQLGAISQDSVVACGALPQAQAWLQLQQKRWLRVLSGMPGFSPPGPIQVCALKSGNPHAQNNTGRIDVNGIESLEQRLALAHEYLHLAFAHHPRSSDEPFIEALARELLGIKS